MNRASGNEIAVLADERLQAVRRDRIALDEEKLMNTGNNQSALREALKKEDASLSTRIPDAASPDTTGRAPREAPAHGASAPAAAEPKRDEEGAVAVKAVKSQTASAAKVKKGASAAPAKSAANTSVAPPAPQSNPAPSTKRTTKAEKKAAAATADKAAKGRKRVKAAEPVEKSRPEKRLKSAVSLAASEHKQLKNLRDDLKDAGHPTKRSQLVRAAISALVGRTAADVVALVKALPALVRGKSAKKKR